MALKIICSNLYNAAVIQKMLARYMHKTNDYEILERIDMNAFTPTFHVAGNFVSVFPMHGRPPLSFQLQELLGPVSMADALNLFGQQGICNGHVFPIDNDNSLLSVYYLEAFKYFPASHINTLCSWKRHTEHPGRAHVWHMLWNQKLKFYFSYHPAVFLAMTRYSGPVPQFLQEVSYFMQTKMPAQSLDLMYRNTVCMNWKLPHTFTPLFISLWHQVMTETAITYLPCKDEQIEAEIVSSISFDSTTIVYMCNSDKLVCLLLILFNKTYRERLNFICTHEPTAPVIADIFTQFTVLQKNEC
jgi:hypothetical protein